MRTLCIALLASFTVLASTSSGAQVAGTTTLGVAVAEMQQVALGWSVKKQILGKDVVNETLDKVGTVDDIIVAPDRSVSYVIIAAGEFVGLRRHDVAIPVDQIEEQDGRIVLRGASKAAIKALPEFEYTKK